MLSLTKIEMSVPVVCRQRLVGQSRCQRGQIRGRFVVCKQRLREGGKVLSTSFGQVCFLFQDFSFFMHKVIYKYCTLINAHTLILLAI